MHKYFCFRIFIVYLLLAFGFILIQSASMSLPVSNIIEHSRESADTFIEEGLYPITFAKYSPAISLTRDQYTDCLMINEALSASINSDKHIKTAILSPCYKANRVYQVQPEDLQRLTEGRISPNANYDWYWHGYLVILRPLLTFMNYAQIRWFNCALMLLIIIFASFLIRQRIGMVEAILTIGVLLTMHFETIPYTMQYVSVFFVAFISIIVLLKWKSFFKKNNNDLLAFFIIGAITVYLDFLTTPVVTLGIPMVYWLCVKQSGRAKWKDVIFLSMMWALGYSMLWISKWAICALTYDPSVLENALAHAEKWSGNDPVAGRLGVTIGLLKKYMALFWSMNWVWWIATSLLMMVFLPKIKEWYKENAWLLIIAFIPLAWSLALVNHNFGHFGFTWRSIIVTLLALAFWVYKNIDWRIIFNKYHG